MQPVSVHLHSFSLRHHFAYQPGFDVFAFIELAREQGFDGVNISANGPGFRHLGGTNSRHFAAVHDALAAHDLAIELDTSDTRPQHMHLLLEVAAALGADRLRTYTRHAGSPANMIECTVADLRTVAARAEATGVKVVLENHEEFLGSELAEIVQRVDSPHVRALFDYGNAQMVGEDPLVALQAMLPFVDAVHVKDHLIVSHAGELLVQGVAAGDGVLPIKEMTARLYDAGLRRFCFENVWSYIAPLRQRTAGLPETASFAVHDDYPPVDGARLDPETALEGEQRALRRGWAWFSSALAATMRDTRSAMR